MNDLDHQPDGRRRRRIREKVFRIVRGRTFSHHGGIGGGRLQSFTVYPAADVQEALSELEAERLIQRKQLPEGAVWWRLSEALLQELRRRHLLHLLAEAIGRPMTTETRTAND